MKNLVLKIKNYQESKTYFNCQVPENLTKDEIIYFGRKTKKEIDVLNPCLKIEPNIIRFENESGIYSDELNQIICYK